MANNFESTFVLDLTAEDFENCAGYNSNTECLVATAASRHFGKPCSAGRAYFSVWSGEEAYDGDSLARYYFSEEDADKVVDAYYNFQPFSIVMTLRGN